MYSSAHISANDFIEIYFFDLKFFNIRIFPMRISGLLLALFFHFSLTAQLIVQGDTFLLGLNSYLQTQQTGRSIEEANCSFGVNLQFDYWISSNISLENNSSVALTIIPGINGIEASLRPLSKFSLDSTINYLLINKPQLQLKLGGNLTFQNFNYWNNSLMRDAPMTEIIFSPSLATLFLITSDTSIGVDALFGMFGNSFKREQHNSEVLLSRTWFISPPGYLAISVSLLFRDYPALLVSDTMTKNWGGLAYRLEIQKSMLSSSYVLTHRLCFLAAILSTNTF